MKILGIDNPFEAPVYHFASCSSTMDEARSLAPNAPHGTVVAADFQTAGRGRYSGRHWTASAGRNLTFTLILRYPAFSAIPTAVTLRSGLAVARAIERAEPTLAVKIAVKWPNDVMLDGKKCSGLIVESDGQTVLIGIGVNIAEQCLPDNAASIASALAELSPDRAALYVEAPHRIPFILEQILFSLSQTLSADFDGLWREELEKRLYMRGKTMRFTAGSGVSPQAVLDGLVTGIDADGSLLLIPAGETRPRAFAAGELGGGHPALHSY
ncbi:MAG: biotin--[acetyl-CoA-carboxylase] ligase [Spirochaetaceae bacterium]|jgi:BirA family biotin operon repressor/biotin-[acetyl-CoA-carboxylase] ligase|nr:biotin--[acetyl-CoA-carboxylase] ligase [Spirochaetaceae bacterium]